MQQTVVINAPPDDCPAEPVTGEPAIGSTHAAATRSVFAGLVPDCLRVGSSTLVCHGLALIASLLVRRLIDPAQMGVWQGLKLFLGYSNYANLGISKGAARQWSVAQGSGQVQAARRGLDLAFSFNTLASAAYGTILLAIAGWLALSRTGSMERAWCIGLIVLAVAVVLQRHVSFHVTVLRAGRDFRTTSHLAMVEAGLSLVAGVLGTWLWGLYGLYGSLIVVLLGSWWYLRAAGAAPLHWEWDTAESRRLIAIGLPIVAAGALATLFRSLDKLTILWLADDAEVQLGCYSLALMVGGQLYGLANMLSLVAAPRMAELYGATGSRRAVAQFAARTSCGLAIGAGLAGAVAMSAAPPVLARLFPAYEQGLAPLGWVVIGAIGWAMSLPASQYLVAVSQERRALAAVAAATALAALGDWLVLTHGGGLTAVALATALSYIAYTLWTTAISIWAALGSEEKLRYALSHALALVPVLAVAAYCEWVWPAAECSWLITCAKLACELACFCPAAWLVWLVAGSHSLPDHHRLAETWRALEARCQKPEHRVLGNWFARRISRPAALPITCVILPTGISAHAVTLIAWLVGLLAVGAFGVGTALAMVLGGLLLQLWYLLDHVDGQVARYRGTDSLDGVQLDYTMHHTLNLLVPLGVGYGLARSTGCDVWWLVGAAWGVGVLLLGMDHDVRAKAMLQRLKRLHGELQVIGGGGGRPAPPTRMPRHTLARLAWCGRKACETHVVINLLLAISVAEVCLGRGPWLMAAYAAGMALLALPLAALSIARRTHQQAAEREFAAWYRPADDHTLVRRDGNWHVVKINDE
ncbi:MAG TPA: lipopolysaccharide biosynthesis protein [Pirellulales bacterium]|jgi:O-antigen/teichoic acid export membrane protein|nr:lipopolysaccharide biosynthesis protein [Pirellulales bacterium]